MSPGRRAAPAWAGVAAVLLALAIGTPPAAAQDAASARQAAREILAEDRFRARDVPRPFRGVLRRLGEVVDDGWTWLTRRLPGGEASAWTLLGALVLALAALGAARLARRQSARQAGGRQHAAPPAERAAELRRRALAAERAGDLDRALRLHFRAGLLDLDAAGIVRVRSGTRNGEIVRASGSPTLREVAERVERVTYGGRPATPEDVTLARGAWTAVRDEARAAA